jgi:hypothetical protein
MSAVLIHSFIPIPDGFSFDHSQSRSPRRVRLNRRRLARELEVPGLDMIEDTAPEEDPKGKDHGEPRCRHRERESPAAALHGVAPSSWMTTYALRGKRCSRTRMPRLDLRIRNRSGSLIESRENGACSGFQTNVSTPDA